MKQDHVITRYSLKAYNKKVASQTRSVEDVLVVLIMAVMVILPVIQIFSRFFFNFTIVGATDYLKQGTLWVAFAGASLAMRENRHLKLSTGTEFLKGSAGAAAKVFHKSISLAVIAAFVIACISLIAVEKKGAALAAPFLPVWVSQLVMPIFVGLMGVRLIDDIRKLQTKSFIFIIAAFLLLLVGLWPEDTSQIFFLPGLAVIILSVILGAPLFVLLGGTALLLFFLDGNPLSVVPAEAYRIASSPTLPTIPLFTLTGYILADAGTSKRLIRLFQALFGWMPGGIAVATVVVCAFFATFTGASSITILALGGLLFPIMIKDNYPEKFSIGLITASGSIGLLFPPALPIILYAVIAATPINKMFLAGILPGSLIILLMSVYAIFIIRKQKGDTVPFSFHNLLRAANEAKWELLLPILIIFGIFGGFTTLVEAAALSALYAVVVACFIHKEILFRKDLPKTILKCTSLVGGIMIVLSFAFGFTSYLIDAEIPSLLFEWVRSNIESKLVFLIVLNLFLVLTGCVMDIFSAIVVVVPLIIPMATSFGVDPVHLGIIFLVNLELGYLTPPVGLNLFLAAFRFEKPLIQIYKTVWPFLLIRAAVVLLVTYIPWLSLWLAGL